MSWHTWKIFDPSYSGEFDLSKLFEKFGPLLSMNYKLWVNRNFTFEIAGILIGIQDSFRFSLHIFLLFTFTLYSIYKKK